MAPHKQQSTSCAKCSEVDNPPNRKLKGAEISVITRISSWSERRSAAEQLMRDQRVCRARRRNKGRVFVRLKSWRCVWVFGRVSPHTAVATGTISCAASTATVVFFTTRVCEAAFAQPVTFKCTETPRFRVSTNTGEMAAAWNGEGRRSEPPPPADVQQQTFNRLWADALQGFPAGRLCL